MFTGIITATGTIRQSTPVEGGRDLTIAVPWTDVEAGESIAVDGACLTVTAVDDGQFVVHVVATSLDRTLFGEYVAQRAVNLERALRAGDRLGGHLVQGHVDGVGIVVREALHDDARLLDIRVPGGVAAISIPLGSITIDGVSLTVNAIPAPEVIQVSLIPLTLERTT
ncbi:MAG: riboflavin synthase, partial [Gemmatimonadales bacterium]